MSTFRGAGSVVKTHERFTVNGFRVRAHVGDHEEGTDQKLGVRLGGEEHWPWSARARPSSRRGTAARARTNSSWSAPLLRSGCRAGQIETVNS